METESSRCDDEINRVKELHNVILTHVKTGARLNPIGPVVRKSAIATNYYLLCFSCIYNDYLYDEFHGADACLIVNNVKKFSERLIKSTEHSLPGWICIDARVSYGVDNPLGVVFSKPEKFVFQHEWRFAWIPISGPVTNLDAIKIFIGNIQDVAEIVFRSAPGDRRDAQ